MSAKDIEIWNKAMCILGHGWTGSQQSNPINFCNKNFVVMMVKWASLSLPAYLQMEDIPCTWNSPAWHWDSLNQST